MNTYLPITESVFGGFLPFDEKELGKCEITSLCSWNYVKGGSFSSRKCENRKYLNRKGRNTSFIVQKLAIEYRLGTNDENGCRHTTILRIFLMSFIKSFSDAEVFEDVLKHGVGGYLAYDVR